MGGKSIDNMVRALAMAWDRTPGGNHLSNATRRT